MKLKIVITGSSGFLGGAVSRTLIKKYDLVHVDKHNIDQLDNLVQGAQCMLHFAGIGSVPDCEKNPAAAYNINAGLVGYVAEIYFKHNPSGHFIYPSSGQVYKNTGAVPFSESAPLGPIFIYPRSKLAGEEVLNTVVDSYQGSATILRLFNHTHKTQSPDFFLPSIYQQFIATPSKQVELVVGNVDIERDLSSLKDLVSAIDTLVSRAPIHKHQIYNLCSGVPKNLRQMALLLGHRLGKDVSFKEDKSRHRPGDSTAFYGSAQKFSQDYQWQTTSDTVEGFIEGFLEDI